MAAEGADVLDGRAIVLLYIAASAAYLVKEIWKEAKEHEQNTHHSSGNASAELGKTRL